MRAVEVSPFLGRLNRSPPGLPLVMGILNVTPDSFSDGGRFFAKEQAVNRALRMWEEGASIIDIGGESTRPGSAPVLLEEERRRVLPVIEALAERGISFSIDTTKPQLAAEAVAVGAVLWNDISALCADAASLEVAARLGCGVVLMHKRGTPTTMQDNPCYNDVLAEVTNHLQRRAAAACAAGVKKTHILLDPGIGFGKKLEHNLRLLAGLERLGASYPLLLGASRKRFIEGVVQRAGLFDGGVAQREGATAILSVWAALHGVAVLRVHEVSNTLQALILWQALEGAARECQSARGEPSARAETQINENTSGPKREKSKNRAVIHQ